MAQEVLSILEKDKQTSRKSSVSREFRKEYINALLFISFTFPLVLEGIIYITWVPAVIPVSYNNDRISHLCNSNVK